MALFVVGVHVNAFFDCKSDTLYALLNLAVPFFFVSSGFLLQNKIEKELNTNTVLRKNIYKILRLYLVWIVIYLPISLYVYWNNDESMMRDFYNYLHLVLFIGETKFAWNLWYLHAMLVSLILLYVFIKLRVKILYIWIIAISLMVLGYYLKVGLDSSHHLFKNICEFNKKLFVNPNRNGLYEGFALISTGIMIRKYFSRLNHCLFVGAILLGFYYLLSIYNLPLNLLFGGAGLFLVAIYFRLNDHTIYPQFRIYSMLIYFLHMYFIFLAFELYGYKIIDKQHFIMAWIAIFCVAFLATYIINQLRGYRPFSWLKYLLA